MKKVIAFSTALLMLSASSVLMVQAEESADTNEKVSAETEVSAEESGTEEKDDTGEDAEDVKPAQDKTVWHISASAPAEAEFTDNSENKEYIVKVINPGGKERGGVDKWDLQFKICGFSISEGHEYTVKYRISADHAGRYYTKIANPDSKDVGAAVAGEVWHNQYGISTIKSYVNGTTQKDCNTSYGDAWSVKEIDKGDTLNVTCNFTGLADLPEAEWCFFLGGAGDTTAYDCFSSGSVVCFSNLVLTDNTTGETLVSAYADIDSGIKGDIDGNGVTDTTDLTLMSLAMLGDAELDDTQISNCDLTGDGKFMLGDVAHLRQYLSKVIDNL